MSAPTLKELCAKATPGPWKTRNEGKCSCGQIWSVERDCPIAEANHGPWGDPYPALRFVDGAAAGGIGATVEAYMTQVDYGDGPTLAESQANAQLIARLSPETVLAVYEALEQAAESLELEFGEEAAGSIRSILRRLDAAQPRQSGQEGQS